MQACGLEEQELSKPRLATPLHACVLVTYLLSYLGTYLFTRLSYKQICTAATAVQVVQNCSYIVE